MDIIPIPHSVGRLARRPLLRAGCSTLQDVAEKTRRDVTRLDGVGRVSFIRPTELLDAHGLINNSYVREYAPAVPLHRVAMF